MWLSHSGLCTKGDISILLTSNSLSSCLRIWDAGKTRVCPVTPGLCDAGCRTQGFLPGGFFSFDNLCGLHSLGPLIVISIESKDGAWTWPSGGSTPRRWPCSRRALQPESHSLDAGWAEFLSPEVSPDFPPQPAVWRCMGSGGLGSRWGDNWTGVPTFCMVLCVRRTRRSLNGDD